jgi:hypothetical protein
LEALEKRLVMSVDITRLPVGTPLGTVLILDSTVVPATGLNGTFSKEANEAIAKGYAVRNVSGDIWDSLTATQFASYSALILGDPDCVVGTAPIAAAVANKSVWGPVVNGNVVVGTDPVFHSFGGIAGATKVVNESVDWAVNQSGKTGLVCDLSCYYIGSGSNTPVPILDIFGAGAFTVNGSISCSDSGHVTATTPAGQPFHDLTDADLSSWTCSVHEAFDKFDPSFLVLAIDKNAGSSYTAPDGTKGDPYILVRGAGVSVISNISLTPATSTDPVGTSVTLTATATTNTPSAGTPVVGTTVTFTVVSGPNAGVTGTAVTNSSGQATFSYTSAVAGTDFVHAQFVDSSSHTETSGNVTVTWIANTPPKVTPPANQTSLEGASPTFNLGSFTDPDGGPWSVDVNWGDSSAHTVFSMSSPGTITPQSHTYAEEGPYTVTVKVTDTHDGQFDSKNFGVTVNDQAVVGTAKPVSAKEAIAFMAPVATFIDPGGAELSPSIAAEYQATIAWGDSSPNSAGTISYSDGAGSKTAPFTVTGTHTYAEEGPYSITVTISHDTAPNIIVHTTATVRDNFGLLVLDPTDPQSLKIDGNGSVTVNHSGAVVVDSSDPSAIFLTGHATLQAAETDVTGDLVQHGPVTFSGELNHEAATPDPFGLGLPTAPATVSTTALHISSGSMTLGPGTYVGGIVIDGTASVTLSGGVYYMKGGGFSVSGQATVTGNGVLLVNAPASSSDTISITGQANVTLTASNSLPDGYSKYDGIAVFQDPASTNTILVTGQPGEHPSLTVTGTVYAPKALLQIDGNGNVVVSAFTGAYSTVGGVVVVNEAMVTGNGDLTINADPPDFVVPAYAGGGVLINYDSSPAPLASRSVVVTTPDASTGGGALGVSGNGVVVTTPAAPTADGFALEVSGSGGLALGGVSAGSTPVSDSTGGGADTAPQGALLASPSPTQSGIAANDAVFAQVGSGKGESSWLTDAGLLDSAPILDCQLDS